MMVGENRKTHDVGDVLTGLVEADAARAWLDTRLVEAPVMAMLVSMPRLQSVNLAYGKRAGDQVLIEVAWRISQFVEAEIGPDSVVARLAGGQFLLASARAESRERWQYLADALSRLIGRAQTVESDAVQLVPRIALLTGASGDTGDGMIDRLAQAAATLERTAGRRVLWGDDGAPVPGGSLTTLEADLLGAMHRNEITVLFQPQFAVGTGALTGAEALARWEHPRFGRISAETLFAVADRGDHVAQVSRHIALRALTLAAGWPADLRLSLNITAEDFALGDVVASIRAAVARSGFAPQRLTLEITEQSLIGDFATCALAIDALADDGIQVALDDFGTGFSNFRALKALPLDALKLDRSLVRDIARDPRDRAIVAAMIAMARALSLKVIAEGIEREDQLTVLRDLGCDWFQGFLRSGPVTPEVFAGLVGAR